ncbi:hypothetical protein [Streptomyces diastatochromogenes]|uniref:hypothetical protein n=1 Tax=Streptomyces diastatochromogenes TaxID=42236 RepID=UPI0036A291A8
MIWLKERLEIDAAGVVLVGEDGLTLAYPHPARAWSPTQGDPAQTFAALQRVEQEAPQKVRRPSVHAPTAGLLYGPTGVEGAREFVERTGAVAG